MLPPPLLALTAGDLQQRGSRAVATGVREALAGGLRGVLVREPGSEDGELCLLLESLLAFRGECPGLWIGVHDRAHLARSLRLDGLHLGFRSLGVSDARTALGPHGDACAIGLSTHAGDLDEAPFSEGEPDYIFHGPVHPTPSKGSLAEHPSPIGRDGLESALAATATPLWALGGLHVEHVPETLSVLGGGRRPAGVAVLSGILGQPEPREAAAAYVAALEEVHR